MKVLMCGVQLLSVMAWSCAADNMSRDPEKAEVELPACTPLAGVYRVSYQKQTGDCAELPEQLARFDDRADSSALGKKCIGKVVPSEDGCDREEDSTCPVNDDTGATIGQARLTTTLSSVSGSQLEGTASISLTTFDGTGCSATYAVSGAKIQ